MRLPWRRATAPAGRGATEADLRACFRLLLGREPNRIEWPSHLEQIGRDLPGVVSGYLNSLEFARRDLIHSDGWRAEGDRATADDIRACFRLLLGRAPHPEEWDGHSAQIGATLSDVVASYLHSLEFAGRNLLAASGAPPQLVEKNGYAMFARPDDLLVGAHVIAGDYEPEVEAVLRGVLRPGMAAIDIGANIGTFALLAAALVGPGGAVLAIEPNGANVRLLEASRRRNGFEHLSVAAVAAGLGTGVLSLHTSHSNGTTSALAEDPAEAGGTVVPCLSVDGLIAATWPTPKRVALIKADVEGAEPLALRGAAGTIARDRPVIACEFSPTVMPGISGVTGPDFLRWLHGQGYGVEVLRRDGPPLAAGQSVEAVMAAFAARGADHLDLVARPIG